MLKIIQRRKIWFALSLALFIASVIALSMWGLKLGIDFTGGTLMEFAFKDKTLTSQEIKDSVKDLVGEPNVQFAGEKDVFVRFKDVDEDTHQKILQALDAKVETKVSAEANISPAPAPEQPKVEEKINPALVETNSIPFVSTVPDDSGTVEAATTPATEQNVTISGEGTDNATVQSVNSSKGSLKNIEEKRFDSIGPAIGSELKTSAIWAIVIALIAMVVYIGWAFRKVSYPVSSYKYGIVATIALFHDTIITMGIFAFLGHYYQVEIGLPFVAAILAVLGYSVNDTIIVFDRTRENLLRSGISDFEEIVNKSVNETMTRSINTTYTTLIALLAVYLFGGESIRYFIVALFVGIFFGTYSSIFIASPLLVTWHNWDLKKK